MTWNSWPTSSDRLAWRSPVRMARSAKVQQQGDRVPEAPVELLDDPDHLQVARVAAVRHVQPCDVHARGRELFDLLPRRAGRAQRAHDLRMPVVSLRCHAQPVLPRRDARDRPECEYSRKTGRLRRYAGRLGNPAAVRYRQEMRRSGHRRQLRGSEGVARAPGDARRCGRSSVHAAAIIGLYLAFSFALFLGLTGQTPWYGNIGLLAVGWSGCAVRLPGFWQEISPPGRGRSRAERAVCSPPER